MIKGICLRRFTGSDEFGKRTVSILKIFSVKGISLIRCVPHFIRTNPASVNCINPQKLILRRFTEEDLSALSVILSDQKVNRFLPNYFY